MEELLISCFQKFPKLWRGLSFGATNPLKTGRRQTSSPPPNFPEREQPATEKDRRMQFPALELNKKRGGGETHLWPAFSFQRPLLTENRTDCFYGLSDSHTQHTHTPKTLHPQTHPGPRLLSSRELPSIRAGCHEGARSSRRARIFPRREGGREERREGRRLPGTAARESGRGGNDKASIAPPP